MMTRLSIFLSSSAPGTRLKNPDNEKIIPVFLYTHNSIMKIQSQYNSPKNHKHRNFLHFAQITQKKAQ